MFRERLFFKVEGMKGWNEMTDLHGEMNALIDRKGMTRSTLWTQSWGPFNELVIETDYPDLATYEKERSMMFADPDFRPLLDRAQAARLPNWGHSEMWESATQVPT
jgi:hypothetical protein